MTHSINFVTPESPKWNEYVDRHPKGAIFHTSEMIEAFAGARNYDPFAIAATDASGDVVALLAAVRIKPLSGIASRITSRSVFYAEPICDDTQAGVDALKELIRMHDREMRSQTLFSEVRAISSPGPERRALEACGHEYQGYLNYEIDLSQGTDHLWQNVPKKMRQKIRSTHRRNIVVSDDTSDDGIERMYPLIQHSYALSRVPLADRSLFHATLERLPPGVVRVSTALENGEPVASIISLVYGGRVFSWYGGTLRLAGRSPFACIVWHDIVWGSENGQRDYDFGGAGWPDQPYGPRRLKASFGGQQVCHGRYRLTYSAWRLKLAETAYRVSQYCGLWSGRSTRTSTNTQAAG